MKCSICEKEVPSVIIHGDFNVCWKSWCRVIWREVEMLPDNEATNDVIKGVIRRYQDAIRTAV